MVSLVFYVQEEELTNSNLLFFSVGKQKKKKSVFSFTFKREETLELYTRGSSLNTSWAHKAKHRSFDVCTFPTVLGEKIPPEDV